MLLGAVLNAYQDSAFKERYELCWPNLKTLGIVGVNREVFDVYITCSFLFSGLDSSML